MLNKADVFLTQHRQLAEGEGEDNIPCSPTPIPPCSTDNPILEKGDREETAGMQVNVIAGVISRAR